MERDKQIALLNRVLHGTVNSVVQYIPTSTPYVPPGYEDKLEELVRLRDEEAVTAQRLADAINELDGVPKVGVFPYWDIDLNYLDLRFMARFGAKHLAGVIEELETHLNVARHDPKLHQLLKDALDEKRTHMATLNEIGGEENAEAQAEA